MSTDRAAPRLPLWLKLLYTGFVKIANNNAAAYNFNINPYNPVSSSDSSYATPGGRPAGLVFGMVHFF